MQIETARPAGNDIDEVLVALLREVLGGAGEPLVRTPETLDGAGTHERSAPAASSADRVTIRRWSASAETCRFEVERTCTFFPGDGNERPSEVELVRVTATRTPGLVITAHMHVGRSTLGLEVTAPETERARLEAAIQRVLAG